MGQVASEPLTRIQQYATRIGVHLKLESHGPYCRVLIDSSSDLVFDEMILGYIEEEMGLPMVQDPNPCHRAWRQLGIIVGDRK